MKWKLLEWGLILILVVSYIVSFFLIHGIALRIWFKTDAPYTDCRIASCQYWFIRSLYD